MARQTARGIARKWGVSPREARKHFAAGTTPHGRKPRRNKADPVIEQTPEPAAPAEPPVAVTAELTIAHAALQRVIRAEEFTDEDLAALRTLLAAGRQLLQEWEETVAEVETGLR